MSKLNQLLTILCLVSIFIILIPYVGDNDFWFHLRTGETIIEERVFPRTDIFSYTAEGSELVNHEWSSQIIYYITYKYFGFAGVSILVAIIGAFFFGIILNRIKNPTFIHYLVIFFSAYSLRSFFVPRPQIFAYLFLLLLVLNLENYHRTKDKKLLVWQILIVFLWANFHASVILAPIVLLIYGFKNYDSNFVKASLAAMALSLVNPFTYKVYTYALQPIRHYEAYHTLIETWPIFNNFNLPGISVGFSLHLSFSLLFLLFILKKYRPFSEIHAYEILLFISFFILPFFSTKYLPFSWAVILPIVIKLLPKPSLKLNKHITVSVIVAISFFSTSMFLENNNLTKPAHSEWPIEAVGFVEGLKGNLFNPYSLGGYIMWQNKDQKVFVDGRFEMFADEEYFEAHNFESSKNVDEIINKYDLSVVITTFRTVLSYTLSSKADWSLVYWDNYVVIFVRDDGKNDQIITDYGLELKYLSDSINGILNKYNQDEITLLINNYNEALRRHPNLRLARYRLGLIYQALDQCDKAIKEWQEVVKIDNTLGSAHLKMAECYSKHGQIELAREEEALGKKYSKNQTWFLGRVNNFQITVK